MMTSFIDVIFATYAVLCLTHLCLQMALAHAHHRRRRRSWALAAGAEQNEARVSVIYPIYNESPGILRLVLERARRCLCVPGLEIVLVDDGSPNRALLAPIYDEFRGERVSVIYQENGGKREAQYAALAVAKGEFIVTVDSDTLIDPDGITRLVAPLRRDARVGAVCGEVLVENRRANLLTRLMAVRYWTSFNLERSAQSLFNSVLCCCGPFSAYRADVVHRVKDAYVNQTFCGRRCTYGDDRHLTNLVLAESLQVRYEPGALAWTFVPESLGDYIKQQTRWNKSFYREILWTIKIADRVHPYVFVEMMLQPLLFIGFTLSASYTLLLLWYTAHWAPLLSYLVAMAVMSAARATYGLVRTLDARFLLFLFYGFLHVLILVPVRFKSLLTLTDNRWGTRARRATNPYFDFLMWAACYGAVLLAVAAVLALARAPGDVEQPIGLARPLAWASHGWWHRLGAALCCAACSLTALVAVFRLSRRRARRGNWGAVVTRSTPTEA